MKKLLKEEALELSATVEQTQNEGWMEAEFTLFKNAVAGMSDRLVMVPILVGSCDTECPITGFKVIE